MLSSSINDMFKLSKTISPPKLLPSDCITLYGSNLGADVFMKPQNNFLTTGLGILPQNIVFTASFVMILYRCLLSISLCRSDPPKLKWRFCRCCINGSPVQYLWVYYSIGELFTETAILFLRDRTMGRAAKLFNELNKRFAAHAIIS